MSYLYTLMLICNRCGRSFESEADAPAYRSEPITELRREARDQGWVVAWNRREDYCERCVEEIRAPERNAT